MFHFRSVNTYYHNKYHPLSDVMRTAATPRDPNDSLNIWLRPSNDNNAEYHIYMHFAEVEKLQPNQSRRRSEVRNPQIAERIRQKEGMPNHREYNFV
ncbi:putative malectin-like carbohydrate-binding domain-containing protein [Rosa chinensis]|uniref:Putative malectin-like carbohydrate-binding domain-containing protein n=1 Tax=Rosa chinensis TaxID=74649 RepID=A0A2P6RXJ9_ROSCH|nr:putative malectin-like carbohydrate-binding domain-containing protein [Rosa chinensis]